MVFFSTSTAITALALLSLTTPSSAANCTREGLLAAAQSYIAAQTAGDPSLLHLSPTNFTYLENNAATDVARGVLSTPLKIDLNRSTADTEACASYTMLISSTGPKPYVLATQIRHPPAAASDNDTDTSATIAVIDTIAATTGSLFFDAAKTLAYVEKEDWSPLPEAERPSRALLRRYADAYLDMWTNATAADAIAWGAQCERVEGSMLTTPCGADLPRGGSAKRNGDRRYVVDTTVGSVDVLDSFDSLGDMPDSHEIRAVDGKVRYVITVTV